MKKKIFVFLSLLVLAIGSLMFSAPFATASAYASEEEPVVVESHYVMTDAETEAIEEIETVVAKTSGYGSYVLGTKNVQLTTEVSEGFKLVGWYIGNIGEGEFYNVDSQDGKYLVNLSEQTFTIVNIEKTEAGGLRINPICQYIEYKTDFTALADVLDGEYEELISYHHIGETFAKTFNIKDKIDVAHVYLNSEEQPEDVVSIARDETLVTKSITVTYEVKEDVTITLDYTKLYKATIKPFIKNPNDADYVLAEGEEKGLLLNTLGITNYFSKIDDCTYLVKNSRDNFNFVFKVVAVDISNTNTEESKTYEYYNVSADTSYEQTFDIIGDDFDVVIKYDSVPYQIEFVFALYENKFASIFETGFNVIDTILSQRGAEYTINATDVPSNYGYQFYGFKLDLTADEISKGFEFAGNDSIEVSIENNTPKNHKVYLLFTKVYYTVEFTGYNTISLESLRTEYPLSKVALSFTRFEEGYSQTKTNSQFDEAGTTTFDKYTVSVSDSEIKVKPTINAGFKVEKYKFIVDGVESDAYDLVDGYVLLDLSAEFIEENADGTNFVIKFVEEYEYYEIKYYTVSTFDSTLTHEVFMANISATSTDADAIISEVSEVGSERFITISNLKRYSKVTLKSEGEISGAKPYNFVKFITADGATTYYPDGAQLSSANLELVVDGNNSINVIYCVPSVRLSIQTVKPEICNLVVCLQNDHLYIEQGDERIAPDEGQVLSWTLEFDEGKSNVITIYFDATDVVRFGYDFTKFTLKQAGGAEITGTKDQEGNVYSFEFEVNQQSIESEAGDGYILSLEFAPKEFHLTAHIKDSRTDTTTTEEKTITIDDAVFEFEMDEGLYANYVAFGSAEQTEYPSLEQSNDYRGNTFTCDFAEILEEISSDSTDIEMNITLSLHTYKVQIVYGLTNSKGTTVDRKVTYPTLRINDEIVPEYSISEDYISKATFSNIEHGTSIKITVAEIMKGLGVSGWYADNIGTVTSYNHDADWLEIDGLTGDKTLYYKLYYINYSVDFVVKEIENIPTTSIARPVVKVNGKVASTISLFDYLEIDSGAVSANGFKLKSIIYKDGNGKDVEYVPYKPYTYKEAEWNSVYNKLYYQDADGNFVRNYVSVPSDIQYYTVADSRYVDTSFNLSNYLIADANSVLFNFEYEYADIVLTDYNIGTSLVVGQSDSISADEFATYKIYVTNADGQVRELDYSSNNPENKITYLDSKVEVEIKFNTYTIQDEGQEAKDYLLSYGVQLSRIMMLGSNYNIVKLDEGRYKFTFNVSNVIPYVQKDGIVQVTYTYNLIYKYITITTNVTDESFYADTNHGFTFSYTESKGINETTDGASKLTTQPFNFLDKITFSYNNKWNQYFTIKNVLVYKAQTNINGHPIFDGENLKIDYSQLIHYDEDKGYADYGIYIFGDVKKEFDLRLIDNYVIVLNVEPILNFEGAELIDEDYYFKPTFRYDSTGAGLSNKLSLGTSSSSNIWAYEKVANRLQISYVDKDGKTVADPINVGKYEVVVSLKAPEGQDELTWLKEINLSYKIYLDIQKAKINLSAETLTRTFEKVYDGTSLYNDRNAFIDKLVLSDGSNLRFKYTDSACHFIFKSGIVATITYTDSYGQHATNKANENETKYNITLSNIYLDDSNEFNRNFILTRNEIVFERIFTINKAPINILGIVLKDKKWDGNNLAVFDKVNARLDDKAIVEGDNVILDKDKLQLVYEIADISNPYGEHYVVIPENLYLTLLTGTDSANYKIVEYKKNAKIYRESISIEIEGVGTVTLFNNTETVDLIPLEAKLIVEVIGEESPEYTKMYGDISQHLTNNNTYAIGYKLAFETNGTRKNVSNQLTLSVPSVDKVTKAIWYSDKQTGTFNYQSSNGNLIIELNEQETKVDVVFFAHQRVLLELWQVLLIVGGAVLLVGTVIAIIIIVRHNTIKKIRNRDII